jgi:ferredoxin-thioredoxin reductase catalytic chain
VVVVMTANDSSIYLEKKKKLWRCHFCNDVHFGEKAPTVCPTCGRSNSFVLIDNNEALRIINDYGGKLESVEKVLDAWENFSNTAKDYVLTPDGEMIKGLAEGILENQKNHGLKYCPCRITKGDESDLKLICPCNFIIQKTWREDGECWCGLYVKREKSE